VQRLPVELTADALQDIASIRFYYRENVGPAVSSRIVSAIRKKLRQIERMPHTGALRPEFGEGVRLHTTSGYVIYVQVFETRVIVLRILHAARDRDAIMSGDAE
jgi:toxin ParE1/3/4